MWASDVMRSTRKLRKSPRVSHHAAQVMAGCVIMLVIAGLLEGFARQLVGTAQARATIGGVMLAIWLAYFLLVRRKAQAVGDTAP